MSSVERFQRQAFETLKEPRWPFVAQLTRMLGSFQTGILESLAPLYAMPFVRGKLVTVGPHLAGQVTITHGLGRAPSGWLVTDFVRGSAATGDVSIYRRQSAPHTDRVLTLLVTTSFESLTVWVW